MNVGLYSALSLASVVIVLLGLRIMYWSDCGHDGVRGPQTIFRLRCWCLPARGLSASFRRIRAGGEFLL